MSTKRDGEQRLLTYMSDHLAGSVIAIHLLAGFSHKFSSEPLGMFADELRREIEKDRDILASLIKLEGSRSRVKEAFAWVAEKMARLKLLHRGDELAIVESLETLELGILGKRALWRALLQIPRMRALAVDFEALIHRAEEQFDRVESMRLAAARAAFTELDPTQRAA